MIEYKYFILKNPNHPVLVESKRLHQEREGRRVAVAFKYGALRLWGNDGGTPLGMIFNEDTKAGFCPTPLGGKYNGPWALKPDKRTPLGKQAYLDMQGLTEFDFSTYVLRQLNLRASVVGHDEATNSQALAVAVAGLYGGHLVVKMPWDGTFLLPDKDTLNLVEVSSTMFAAVISGSMTPETCIQWTQGQTGEAS